MATNNTSKEQQAQQLPGPIEQLLTTKSNAPQAQSNNQPTSGKQPQKRSTKRKNNSGKKQKRALQQQKMKRAAKSYLQPYLFIFNIVALIAIVIVSIHIFNWIDFTKIPWGWTGFSGKTLWDWFQLLVIPAILAFGGLWYSQIQKEKEQRATDAQTKTEREIAKDNQQEEAFQTYLNKMSDLLLEKHLRDSKKDDEVRNIARVHTLTILPRLDSIRKGRVLQFLYDSSLIDNKQPIIDLHGADLSRADLVGAKLRGANLSGANFSEAQLETIDLSGANLSEANFSDADMHAATLSEANLTKAYLTRTDLEHSHMNNSNLSSAYLWSTNLAFADLEESDLSEALVSGASLFCAFLNKANLRNAFLGEFSGLVGADLSGAILWDACLNKIILSEAYLIMTDLRDADLEEANLEDTLLIGADLRGAKLTGANLMAASLEGAVVTKEQLAKAASITDATISDGQNIPVDPYPRNVRLNGDDLLTARIARGLNLSGTYTRQLKKSAPIQFITRWEDLQKIVME